MSGLNSNTVPLSHLIVCEPGEAEIARALRDRLAARGGRGEVVTFGNPTPAGIGDLASCTHLVALLPRSIASGEARERLGRMVGRLQAIVQMSSSLSGAVLALVQFGGGRFGSDRPELGPEGCGAAAFAASLHLERPDLRVRAVDLDPSAAPEQAAERVLTELSGPAPFAAVGYDAAGLRLVPKAKLRQSPQYPRRPASWTADDVLLITGGAKGITAECALALGRATRAQLVLVGSSPAPAPGAEGELARTLARFATEGLKVRYEACDVSDADAVSALVQRVRQEVGPITGVIHAAGVNRPRRAEQVSAGEAFQEVAPKLLGAWNLCQALADAPPRLFAGFTSIIGVTGMPGNAWYAFSNELLDLVLRGFGARHPGTATLAIAFSVWGETGMGARMGSVQHLGKMGIGAIPTEEGVRRFLRLIACDAGAGQVVVTAPLAGLDTWSSAGRPGPSGLRFVDRIVRAEPGVDLVARTRLTLDRDRYVRDHVYNGSYLFPTVFGLEAMAQAAAYVTGEAQPEVVRIEDVSLERPIVVDPQHGVEIEIRALALESETDGERSIRVGIRTEQTGFATDHFSAVLVLGKAEPGPTVDVPRDRTPLGIDPATDLYATGLLFQGPLFQRMGPIYELDGDHTVFASENRAGLEAASFGPGAEGPFLLGDPYFRDVLLQAGQVTIPREVCLPIRIERIERFRHEGPPEGRRFVVAPYKVREGREYTAEVYTTDEQGRVVERLTGYRLRILEERPQNPTAEELAHPGERDERIVNEAVEKAAAQLGLERPAVALAELPGLPALPRSQRHERERPVIDQAVRTLTGTGPGDAADLRAHWLASGKPALAGAGAEGLDVSLSHDAAACLCVAGRGPQGCDLETVRARAADDWTALLGQHRNPLLADLRQRGDSRDRAGTRVWSAVEAVRKATQAVEFGLSVEQAHDAAVLLRAEGAHGETRVLTLPVTLTRGRERMLALVVAPEVKAQVPAPTAGINPDWHCVRVAHDGPQGQPVQELRFVVSFQESSSISRHVPASKYLVWMGKMRELVMSGIPSLVPLIASGEWGLVTNWGDVRVCGEATANDVIQMRFWTDAARGSEVEFHCDFWKVVAGDRYERVAFGSQKATWVRLIGHGQVAPAPFPEDLARFIAAMGPRPEHASGLRSLPEPLSSLEMGEPCFEAPAGPAAGRLLRTETFQTTLEEANLVGNVYFANYFAWQGRVRDLFLHAVAPECFRGVGERGELIELRTHVDYLRETMPFDRVQVELRLRSLSRSGAVLGFEYFRLLPDGKRQKLSVGSQEIAWVERSSGVPAATPFPEAVRRALEEAPAARPAPARNRPVLQFSGN